ncbi:hypothetical protein LTR36_000607 [Oleoguttula mirabilis]|uniref:L domain-like protein n=1 Tax=Oleoguttula mirabilis TaxID=1507867 RepID=A0AAV9JRK5_9PEZI|nr:hypothetical protein LTR36_000607 [Oleoguttula mirabilis]
MDPTTTPSRPSGLPRPSRLPILRNKSSQIFPKPVEVPVEKPKPPLATPRLQKRSSYQVLPRTALGGLKDVPASNHPPASRASNLNGTKHLSKPPTTSSTRPGLGRPSSRGNQQRVPPSLPTKSIRPDDEENHDQLGRLDSFRTASRQGFYDDEPSPVEFQEPVKPDEELFRPRDRTKPRPSLSDRTVGSLQTLPSTPKDRRRSSFFTPLESPMGPPPRPGSVLSRNGSSHSRPGTSDGYFPKPSARPASPAKKAPVSAKSASRTATVQGFGFAPVSAKRRSISTAFSSSLQAGSAALPPMSRSPSPSKQNIASTFSNGGSTRRPLTGSKTFSARPSKPRPALGDAFAPRTEKIAPAKPAETARAAPKALSTAKRVASNPTNTSSALREQIAAAKAAARKEKAKHDSPQQANTAASGAFEADVQVDPFNLAPKDGKHILRNRIKAAWTDGKLNIAAMGLKQIPDEVLHMYDASAMEEGKVNWAEVVDLTKLIAADNEFEDLGNGIFPDKSAGELAEDEESQGNQFGGLETLDLHGNSLQMLPLGLRRLERLTSLNLAHNKLDNACFDILSQITSLKELRLGHNTLSGNLPTAICQLPYLETLDVQANRLLGLPEALRELVSLKVLNVAGNQLTAVPMDALELLPLMELDASSNALIGSLFPLGGASGHPKLQTLRVANNSLAALTFAESLDLPLLRTIDVTNNHLTVLPPVTGWTELITLTAGDNKMAELPVGFTGLRKLRNVNLTSNELRLVDPEIARMESLESLILASNPLREKKYLTMRAEDIKRDLRVKLEPDVVDAGELSDPDTVVGQSDGTGSARSAWSLKANGVLDLASRALSDDANDALGSFLQSNEVKQLLLQANKLTAVPPALWLAQDLRILDLSGNTLGSDYFSADLELPSLRELNLRNCRLTTLEPLTSQLAAASLHSLDITANRLTGPLPTLRATYPALTTLMATDNKFTSVTADALRGLQTVNLASNEIQQLPAELGLLWEEGLKNLAIGSNAFRVPNYRVLEKGTEATLRWLRDRLPAGGDGAWGGEVEEVE